MRCPGKRQQTLNASGSSDLASNPWNLDLCRYGQPTGKICGWTAGETVSNEDMEEFKDSRWPISFKAVLPFSSAKRSGMLASLTARHLGSHNAVLEWRLSVLLGAIGLFDPACWGFEELQVHFGGGAALFSTDAIGGSVHMAAKLKFKQGHHVGINTCRKFWTMEPEWEYSFSDKRYRQDFGHFETMLKAIFPTGIFQNQELRRPAKPCTSP